jgi:hypothetical protein
MALQQKFRAALNGFNREDVVNFIARMTHDHEVQMKSLKGEMGCLQEELAAQREKNAELLRQINELLAQAREKQAREELELFRQAEKTQREAEEQVARAYEKANSVLADSLTQVDGLTQALGALRQTLEAKLRED